MRENFFASLLTWAPICCLAAEREPSTHPFYRALACFTRERLLDDRHWTLDIGLAEVISLQPSAFSLQSEDEVRLRDIIRFLLAPARCGLFLSRTRFGQMARALGMRLPFGSRFEVAEWLFISAGENGLLAQLLEALRTEAEAWATAYRAWAAQWPHWSPNAALWLARIAAMQKMLDEMERVAGEAPIEIEP